MPVSITLAFAVFASESDDTSASLAHPVVEIGVPRPMGSLLRGLHAIPEVRRAEERDGGGGGAYFEFVCNIRRMVPLKAPFPEPVVGAIWVALEMRNFF